MDSSLRTKCTDKDAEYKVVEQQDLKKKPEVYRPIEHSETPRGDARMFRPRRCKSVKLMKHNAKACGEVKETMGENMTKIDVRNPDGEGHEEDKTYTVKYENMDSSVRTKCTDKDAEYEVIEQKYLELCVSQKEKPEAHGSFEHSETACGEAKETMEENMTKIDVRNPDGQGHEEDKVPRSLQKEKSEGNGSTEHGVMTHGEAKETMEENMTKIDVCKPDGEGHEEDKKEKPEGHGSFEHSETACGESKETMEENMTKIDVRNPDGEGHEEDKKTMRENVSDTDVCNCDGESHGRDKELCSSQREKWMRMDSLRKL